VALAVGTTIIVNIGRRKYAWVTFVPLCFVSVTTITAGFMSLRDSFWPMAIGPDASLHVQGYVQSICTVIMLICAVIILLATARRCVRVLGGSAIPTLEASEA